MPTDLLPLSVPTASLHPFLISLLSIQNPHIPEKLIYILDFFLEKYQWIEVVGRQLVAMKSQRDLSFVIISCQGLGMSLNLS